MSRCPYVETCPLFAEFKNAHAKAVWIEVYCQGPSQRECERLKLREQGLTPPPTLLPSGDHLNRPGR